MTDHRPQITDHNHRTRNARHSDRGTSGGIYFKKSDDRPLTTDAAKNYADFPSLDLC